jgi:ADP-ribose pyrophosphatase YjhB (NUDIX family)
MSDKIRQFGVLEPDANYVLRPGGYAVIHGPVGKLAILATNGNFYLPGGGQNTGETAEDAAIRESLEECGLHIRITRQIGIADEVVYAALERTHFRKRCTFFAAELVSDEIGIGEADVTLVWMPAEQAISQLRHKSQRWAIRAYAA